jgi:acyl carrier protein
MSDPTTVQRITRWFLEGLHLDIPSPETDLFETGVLDSLGFVELMLHLEQEFGVKLTLEEVELDNFRSVERIAAFLLNGGGTRHLVESPEERVTRRPTDVKASPKSLRLRANGNS